MYHTFVSRYRFQPKIALDYFSSLVLEPLLCCILGLILLRVRSCDDIKGLSYSRLPHWVGKSGGMDALPNNLKSFIQTINYVEESFDKVKLNYLELGSPEPRNESVEKRSRAYNWILQAGYFSSAMFRKKRAR